jgi:hypothetical protein
MSIWPILSLALVAAVVGMFSGPLDALRRPFWTCSFEVFVELVDRMNWSMAPALTVLLPAAFFSLCFSTLSSYEFTRPLFMLDITALALFCASLLIAAIFEAPLVKNVATWPAALETPDDWRNVRRQWLRIHTLRVALGFASVMFLLVSTAIQILPTMGRH